MEEESRGVVLGTERLEVAVAPLEPSPSTVLVAAAAECSPVVPVIPLIVLFILLPILGMLARWLMLLLLLLLLWVEWSAGAEGCDEEYEPEDGAKELTLLLSTLV